jgi:hypothetical protein
MQTGGENDSCLERIQAFTKRLARTSLHRPRNVRSECRLKPFYGTRRWKETFCVCSLVNETIVLGGGIKKGD